MKATLIDPRDQEWQVDAPRFRVYYWQPIPDSNGWASEEWELDCGDVGEALSWAGHDLHERRFVLYAVVPAEDGRVGLVTLFGSDPTEPGAGAPEPGRS